MSTDGAAGHATGSDFVLTDEVDEHTLGDDGGAGPGRGDPAGVEPLGDGGGVG